MEQKGIVCFFVINCVPVRSLYNFKRKTNPPWEKGMNPYRIIRHNSDSPQKKQEFDAIINTQIERERWRNCSVYIQIPRRKKSRIRNNIEKQESEYLLLWSSFIRLTQFRFNISTELPCTQSEKVFFFFSKPNQNNSFYPDFSVRKKKYRIISSSSIWTQ